MLCLLGGLIAGGSGIVSTAATKSNKQTRPTTHFEFKFFLEALKPFPSFSFTARIKGILTFHKKIRELPLRVPVRRNSPLIGF